MSGLTILLIVLTLASGAALLWYLVFGGEEVDETTDSSSDPLSITAAERIKDALATTTEEYRGAARKSRVIALKESLERSLDSREGVAQGSAKDRMIMPWFMLVGADGSGKKTILANNGLPLPWGPPIEVDSLRKDAGKWWLYDDAVVLEAPAAAPGATEGSSTLPPDQTVVDSSIGWSTLLHMLRRERPDSPLNGIIVTISCADLLDARLDSQKMEEQAERIRVFLERTRRFLGVRLPLHVLVTKCDTMPGFRSFTESVPEARRQDIFGWSNPNDPEMKFEPGWVDDGFTELQRQLADLRDEMLAAPEQVRDSVGVFVFESEFSEIQEALKSFVARLMPIGERRPSLFFRGFYFTGDVIDEKERALSTTLTEREGKRPTSSRISAEIAKEPHRMVFLRSLFADKIFKEAGLARAAAKLRFARDRRVVIAQAAAILIAIGGGFGLWSTMNGLHASDRTSNGLRRDAETLTRVLSGVAIDLDELKQQGQPVAGNGTSPVERRSRDAAVIELVGQMRDVPNIQVRSPFIPSSWFSRLPGDIRASMMAGVRDIVLPVTRQRLMERAERILGSTDPSLSYLPDELDPADARSVTRYLNEVRLLSQNIDRYNSIADSSSGTVSELSGLLEYLFAERLIVDSTFNAPDFEDALVRATAPKIPVSSAMASTVMRRVVTLVSDVAGTASRQLAPRYTAIRPADDLRALQGLGSLVDLLDTRRGVLPTVGDSSVLGLRLARMVRDTVSAHLQLAAVRIARDTLAPDSSARRLHNVIARLHTYRLMQPVEGRVVANEIRPNHRLRWDVGSLELVLSLQSEFRQAVVSTSAAFPGQRPERLSQALELQLRDRAVDVTASAQRFTPLTDVDDPFAEIRAQGINLSGAAARLIRVAAMLDTLGADEQAMHLLASAVRQAEQALAMAEATFTARDYIAPVGSGFVQWQGVLPLSYAALGTTDSLPFSTKLFQHETEIHALATGLEPSLRFLRHARVSEVVNANALLERWEVISSSVLGFVRGDPSSSLGRLHRYLTGDLGVTSLEACRELGSRPAPTGDTNDPFELRRRQFHAAVASRCVPGGSQAAVASYQQLRNFFATRLAGRFPFADTIQGSRLDANPFDVADFVEQFDEFLATADAALRADPRLGRGGRQAFEFIDAMRPVRAFFAPYAAADAPRSTPVYGMTVGATGLVDSLPSALVEVQVGRKLLGLEEAVQPVTWRSGERVSVVLTPFDTSKVRTLLDLGGPWAALRFAQKPGNISVKLYHPDTHAELALPVFPTAAPGLYVQQR
ncbi:MAG TPA: type VI secretion protein IcmF/TssM N-terminal domain-containing protein [Gemmatimonadaceae bacterium]|nr:type VI secretion protein IcmF/TssM N-terminal domain-containing protein [Gemmatimonadaceae bacterium]